MVRSRPWTRQRTYSLTETMRKQKTEADYENIVREKLNRFVHQCSTLGWPRAATNPENLQVANLCLARDIQDYIAATGLPRVVVGRLFELWHAKGPMRCPYSVGLNTVSSLRPLEFAPNTFLKYNEDGLYIHHYLVAPVTFEQINAALTKAGIKARRR